MKHWRTIIFLMASLMVGPVQAEELMMARIHKPYAEAMLALQDIITLNGYQVMRVQRVDIGLQSRGFTTAEYRVVFFGKADEVQAISKKYPELMPYLPLKITLFAEGESALLVTNNPHVLRGYFKAPELQAVFARWETDVQRILDILAESK